MDVQVDTWVYGWTGSLDAEMLSKVSKMLIVQG